MTHVKLIGSRILKFMDKCGFYQLNGILN